MEAIRDQYPESFEKAATLTLAGTETELRQAPTELPEEVLARFKPKTQLILNRLVENSGQPLRPKDFGEFFPTPDTPSTATKISQSLREITEDPEIGQWLHRWGNGGRSSPRLCLWGTLEQAEAAQGQPKRDTAPGIPEKDPRRLRLPRKQQGVGSGRTDGRSGPARKDSIAGASHHYEAVISDRQRDQARGAAILRAWGVETLFDDDETCLRVGGVALQGANILAAEVVEAVSEVEGSLSPTELQRMLADFQDQRLGLKSVIESLDFLRGALAACGVHGWKDSGPVTENGDDQRLVRLDFPDAAEGQDG